MIGVYKIQNLVNNKVYVGSSKSMKRRKYQHFRSLKLGEHQNRYLQNSYNKYGYNAFVFVELEETTIDDLISREEYWINYYKSSIAQFGYNLSSFESGHKRINSSTKEKMKKANKTLKPIIALDKSLNFVKRFDSIKQAAVELNLKRSSIQNVLKGKKLSTGNFKFILDTNL